MGGFYCRMPHDWMADLSLCLFEWQTLIGGVLAISAAILGAILLWIQIKQAERHESQRRSRKFAANRATLPLTLSEITKYARTSIAEMKSLHDQISFPSSMVLQFDPPNFKESSILSLRDFIDYSIYISVNDCLSEIIREVQILSSRMSDINLERDRSILRIEIEEYIVQAGRLNLITGILFPFARSTEDALPAYTDWEAIASHFSVSQNMPKDEYPGVYSILERRANAWSSVWPKIPRTPE
jgi:hypothetical protein